MAFFDQATYCSYQKWGQDTLELGSRQFDTVLTEMLSIISQNL